ncbi:MAG: ATP-dependent DNA helicase RecG [Bdellovibrionota bacterium]
MPLELTTPIQFMKGVGPKLGDLLRKRGIDTVSDLFDWYPRTYEDRRAARTISSLQAEQIVSLAAMVVAVKQIPMGSSHRKMYEVTLGDATGRINCKYFRVPYRGYFDRFARNQKVRISGKVILYRGKLEFHHPDIQPIYEDDPEELKDILIPVYTETEGLSTAKVRKLLEQASAEIISKSEYPEIFPAWLREKYKLATRAQALKEVHFPHVDNAEYLLKFTSEAQHRIIFEEFFWIELYMASIREGVRREKAIAISNDGAWVKKIREKLPFELTGAQERTLSEVLVDIAKPHPMHRLVQGDVGSGKTMVALLAAVQAAQNGIQTAIMAPTEILAEQHFKNAKKFLTETLGIEVELITGRLKTKEYKAAVERVKSGEAMICVGTHALIEESVEFKNLGLVIVDEQHRFGVEQRNKLKKNNSPHFLVMTATPIPRTLAMTVYGDLDVSIIDELPPGRSPIVTRKVFPTAREKVFGFMREQISKGRQAYVIYPLVEESEKIDLKNAVEEFEVLQAKFPEFKLGLLHGRMKGEEKEAVMADFRDGKTQILISTTVVEVGVDVPNATIMVIEHAERFGLSQLHQLRGRVGRGEHKSYCVLMLGYAMSEEALKRAEVIVSTTDGFKISEADLELRGPGEFLGRRQSGLPGFKMANLVRDIKILKEARDAAHELLARDPYLTKNEHALIKEQFEKAKTHIVG